jgi:hypothetical protein
MHVVNPSGPGKSAWWRDGSPGQAVGQVYGVLAWSPDARHWHYIAAEQSFIPLGRPHTSGKGGVRRSEQAAAAAAVGEFDCCGVFIAKQNPSESPQYTAGNAELPIYYAGSNGAFFGPRAGAMGLAYVGKHAFAGLAGPGVVQASSVQVQTGTLRVTAYGAVRVAVVGVGKLSFASCTAPLAEFVSGAVGLRFQVPAGSVLYAFHV